MRVEKVKRGRYGGSEFTLAIHSPALLGLEVGQRYTIKVDWGGHGRLAGATAMVAKGRAGMVLLVAGTAVGGETIPGRAVALRFSAFKDGFRLCSRQGPRNITGYWELDQVEAERIDRALIKYVIRSGLKARLTSAAEGYVRQYLGLVRGGRRFVYINAFGARAGEDREEARSEFIAGCDGGSLFWGIEYDVRTKSFLSFAVNSALDRDPLDGLGL